MSTLRVPTAFELFLQRRQQAAAEATGGSESRLPGHAAGSVPARALPAPPPPLPTGEAAAAAAASTRPRPLALGALRASHGRPLGSASATDRSSGRNSLRRSAPDLVPQVVASLPSPRLAGGGGSGEGAAAASSGGGTGRGGTAVYGELASAAASLASVAEKLARGSLADRSVAASYETLAQAAADLAASACLIRPLTSSASNGLAQYGSGGGGRAAPPPPPPPPPSGRLSETAKGGSALPRAVDPMAASAASSAPAAPESAASAAAAAAKSAPQQRHSTRPVTGGSSSSSSIGRARVYAPRFPGYNPLIHLVESGLPPPGSAGPLRPTTSSPITHQLVDSRAALQPASTGNASAASHLSRRSRRGASSSGPSFLPGLGGTNGGGGGGGGPDAADLSRLPVLVLGPDGQPSYMHPQMSFGAAGPGGRDVWFNEPGGGGGGGGSGSWNRMGSGGGGQMADPPSGLGPYADARGVLELRPPEAATTTDMDQEEVDMRYNKVLSVLRERVYARGPGRLAAAFRDLDREGCGLISRRDFTAVLQGMNLGAVGLVDQKVADLILTSVDGGGGGGEVGGQQPPPPAPPPRVAYGDFVNALRFGTLPWRGHNRKLRHRLGADPDQPIGPPQMSGYTKTPTRTFARASTTRPSWRRTAAAEELSRPPPQSGSMTAR